MPDLREVFEMTTKQMGEPDVDSWREQEKRQRTANRNRKIGAIAVAAVLVGTGALLGISALRTDDGPPDNVGSNPTASPLPTVADGPLEPGRYVISTTDPDFNASHRITIDVPVEGYSGWEGVGVFKDGVEGGETGVALWVVDDVFTDACEWRGTRSAISSADDLVATLADQEALRPLISGQGTVDGFAGTRMQLTVPSLAKLSRCDGAQFRLWTEPGGGPRYLNNPGQDENLCILDVDGAVLVIDVPVSADAPFKDRADASISMLHSIRIEPR